MRYLIFLFAMSGCADYVYQNPVKDVLAMLNEPNAQRQAEMEKKIDKATLYEARRMGHDWVVCRVQADDLGYNFARVRVEGVHCVAEDTSTPPLTRYVHVWQMKAP